jgi:hypothetical protein
MSSTWKGLAGSMVLAVIAAFAYGGFCIYVAMQYSAIAPNQITTTAYMFVTGGSTRNDIFDVSDCNYSFTVDGRRHGGDGPCPKQSGDNAYNSDEGRIRGLGGSGLAKATVYYDPADPSNNGLTDFNARSEASYLSAKVSIGLGILLILLMVLGAALIFKTSKEAGGIVVDAEGTVIYPDRLFSGQLTSADNSPKINSGKQ